MEVIFAWVFIIALIPATIAKNKGRSFVLWWLYGAALFIVALPHSLIMTTNRAATERQQLAEGMKKCPDCAELIQSDAKICRYCRYEFIIDASVSRSDRFTATPEKPGTSPVTMSIAIVFAILFVGLCGKVFSTDGSPSPNQPRVTLAPDAAKIEKTNSAEMTRAEFIAIKEGMSYEQVVKIVGSEGEMISSSNVADIKTVMISWKGNSFASNANAIFQNGKLVSKTQIGLN